MMTVLAEVDLGAVADTSLRFLLGRVSLSSSAACETGTLRVLPLLPGVLDTILFDTQASGLRETGGMD